MTAAELQRDLVEEVKKLFQGITTENTSGETVTGLNVYEQNLPVVTDDEEDESDVDRQNREYGDYYGDSYYF